MYVGEILDRKGSRVFAVRPDERIADAVALFAARNIGSALVIDADGTLAGILSERDITRALSKRECDVLGLPVGELMTRSVITCLPETPVGDALSLMGAHRIRHLPVVRESEILGVISIRDMLEVRVQSLEEHFAALVRAEQEASRA